MAIRSAGSYIPTLDGWRGIAITMVTLHHTAMGWYSSEAEYSAKTLFAWGTFGVDIFFGISGFLITLLLIREREASGRINLGAFYRRRFFRIIPAYAAFLLAVTALGLWASRAEALSALFFWRNYLTKLKGGLTGNLWSLSVEEHFYWLWPAILIFAGKRNGKNVAALLALAVGIWRMIASQHGIDVITSLGPRYHTDMRLDGLLWGCMAAYLFQEPINQFGIGPGWAWASLPCLGIICVLDYSPLTTVLLAFFIPCVIASTAGHPQWWISRLLESGPLRLLGNLSYSLYLWQGLFLLRGWEPIPFWWQRYPVNLLMLSVAVCVSYFFLEQPLRRFGSASFTFLVPPSAEAHNSRQSAGFN